MFYIVLSLNIFCLPCEASILWYKNKFSFESIKKKKNFAKLYERVDFDQMMMWASFAYTLNKGVIV